VRKPERAALILKRLEELYPETPVPLDHSDAFTLLVAVLLSAQCTDKKVNEVTPALFMAGPTPATMAALSEETILAHIRQLGLARTKARHVKRLAELLLERHGGEVPRSFSELEALPGVGHKTASVVMAQAFAVPAFPVDTHIHRLAQRWGLSSGESVARTETDLMRLFPRQAWNKLHLQIIFYGREHCSARGCDGTLCPLCRELMTDPVILRRSGISYQRDALVSHLAAYPESAGGFTPAFIRNTALRTLIRQLPPDIVETLTADSNPTIRARAG
jgi:endonuclease-3